MADIVFQQRLRVERKVSRFWGVQVKVSDFLGFYISCSPGHLLFRMGSLVSQLQAVAEIWRDEVGSFSRVFGNLYGKMAKNIGFQKSVISFFQHWGPLKPPFLVLWQYLSNIYKITEGILKILIFWLFMAIYIPNFGRFFNFWQKIDPKVAIKSLKIKIFKIPSVIL